MPIHFETYLSFSAKTKETSQIVLNTLIALAVSILENVLMSCHENVLKCQHFPLPTFVMKTRLPFLWSWSLSATPSSPTIPEE